MSTNQPSSANQPAHNVPAVQPAKPLSAAPAAVAPKHQTVADVDEVPIATQRALDGIMERFFDMLTKRAVGLMKARGSTTPTDADLEDAYRELTRPTNSSRMSKCLGDGALVVGGTLLALVGPWFSLSIAGVCIVVLGLYIREFND